MKTRERNAAVTLHPEDVADCQLQDGDDALVANETGQPEMRVLVSDAVPRGVALTHKGRWARHEPHGANVNLLNPGTKADMGESTCVHGVEVTIVPMRSDARA